MKKIIALFMLAMFLISGCTQINDTYNKIVKPVEKKTPAEIVCIENCTTEPTQTVTQITITPGNQIKIGNWNVQIFGKSKMEKSNVVEVLAQQISKYDIMTFQEIRDSSETAFPELMSRIPDHRYIISDRLGRSISKEQYAIIYKKDVELIKGSEYVYHDTNDIFEREPFVARFKKGNFDFAIITIHTKPEDATREIEGLRAVISDVKNTYINETDIIISGDLNAEKYFEPGFALSEMHWLITDDADTTVSPKTDWAYDRIIVTDSAYANYINCEVDRFDMTYGLAYDAAKEVSDHYPVYCMFDTTKS